MRMWGLLSFCCILVQGGCSSSRPDEESWDRRGYPDINSVPFSWDDPDAPEKRKAQKKQTQGMCEKVQVSELNRQAIAQKGSALWEKTFHQKRPGG